MPQADLIPPVVLLADDDPDDRQMAREALDEAELATDLRCVADGEELLDYLRHRGAYGDREAAPAPAVILLDLNMPLKDGREVLADIKTDPALRRIPVVVLTTSSSEEDVMRSYELGASSYITKPVNFTGLVEVMQDFGRWWFSRVELPGVPR